MCPPATSSPIDIDFASTDEELLGSLERITRGSQLPSNVIDDVNPYSYNPTNLPEGVWFLVSSKDDTSAQDGRWKVQGEACKIFSNSNITGWKTTLEFYEGQVPYEHKTDWILQEFTITEEKLCENKKAEDSSSLCKVFRSDIHSLNHDKQQNMSSVDITSETYSHSTQSSFAKAKDDTKQGSTSKPQVNDDIEPRAPDVNEGPINHPEDILPEFGYISDGDFLELWDLEYPASPSSSFDNSSCMTMSSNEYFDSDALLQDLEPRKTNGVGPENAGNRYSCSTSNRPDEMVLFPGSFMNVESSKPGTEEILQTKCSKPGSSMVNIELASKALKQGIQGQKADQGVEGSSSYCHNLSSSSHGHIALQNGEKKAGVGRMKKLKRKYFCFMPF